MIIEVGGEKKGKIKVYKATITQELNGEYTCQFTCSANDPLAEFIVTDAIVYLQDVNSVQAFRLERPEVTLTQITAFGWHITYDLAQEMIVNRAWLDQEGSDVWPELLHAGIEEGRFTGSCDISSRGSTRIVRRSVLNAMVGDNANSFINRWGGDLERDNFTVNMRSHLGDDLGYTVSYRKNLTGINVVTDNSTVVNRIIPTFLDENDSALMLPEVYIDSPRIGDTAVPHVRSIHFGDIKVGEELEDGTIPYPTLEDAQAQVRSLVGEVYSTGGDVPLLTVDIEFIRLRDTLEYKDYQKLEDVSLGDTVGAVFEDYSWKSRVVKYQWDCLLKKYNSIILGSVRPAMDSLNQSIVDEATRESNSAIYRRTESMNGLIGKAMQSADGKNSIFYSSTPPEGEFVINDTWFETDNGNKMHQWDGTSWSERLAGENAIADASITNAKVSNLDAGSIVTGTLDAGRVTIGKDTTFESEYDPSKVYTYFDFGEVLKIGNPESDLSMELSNEELAFLNGATKTLILTGQVAQMPKAEVYESLLLVNHKVENYNGQTIFRPSGG